MKYIIDKDATYIKDIITHIRAYNTSFTGEMDSITEQVIVQQEQDIIGSMKVSFMWDWVSIEDVYYTSVSVLKSMLSHVYKKYQDKANGIHYYSPLMKYTQDFINYGFYEDGILPKTKECNQYYYLTNTDFVLSTKNAFDVVMQKTLTEKQKTLIKSKLKKYNKFHNVPTEKNTFIIVALDEDQFAGGVKAVITRDTMYVNLLVVKKHYRKQQVGKRLMKKLEEEAKKQDIVYITLETAEFQAKEFYKKLGYEEIQCLENYPEGYKMYALIKKL